MTSGLARHLPVDGDFRPLESSSKFLRDVLSGLSQPQKTIPPQYFYDNEGSALFERICDAPEYYLTRTELSILRDAAPAIAARAGPNIALVEFGSGSSTKARILLDALKAPAAYVAIDISGDHMRAAANELRTDYPGLDVVSVEADFLDEVRLPREVRGNRLLGFFPGSTIGNLSHRQAEEFMRRLGGKFAPGSGLLIGVDMKKHGAVLDAAYNDAAGVTAAFNLNLLVRINRELGGNFDLRRFRHNAFYNAPLGRIEMHLESTRPQSVQIAGLMFVFCEGETIHTENSYKYSVSEFQSLAVRSGWSPVDCFVGDRAMFSIHYLMRC